MDFVAIFLDRTQELMTGFIRVLPQLGIALLVLLLTWIAARSARSVMQQALGRSDIRSTLLNLFETLASVVVWAIGVMIASSVVFPGVTPANLLALVGLGSVAIGFAFKDIFENFLAGVLIMLRKKVNIGDVVECETVGGRVEQITLRDTYLRHLSNELVLVPNAFLFKNPLKILTDGEQRRYTVDVGVGYSSDLNVATDAIRDALTSTGSVDSDRPIEIFATEFGDNAINLLVRWWAGSTPLEGHTSRDQVIRAIKSALDQAGVEIPFPQRTVWLSGSAEYPR